MATSDNAPQPEAVQAKALLDGGEPEAARIILEHALVLPEVQEKPAVVVSMLGMLAACHTRLMRFEDAEVAYDRAVRIADEKLDPDHVVRVIVICSWAAFERGRGALDQEKKVWQMVLPVLQRDARFAAFLTECLRCLNELETLAPEERQLRESLEVERTADQSIDASFDQRSSSFAAVQRSASALVKLLEGMGRRRERSTALRDGLMMRPEELWRRLTGITAPYRHRVLDQQRCRFNLFLLDALQNPRPEAAQTALETLVWRRGIGLEIHRCANRLGRHNPAVREMLDTLRFSRASSAAMLFAAPPDEELRPARGTKMVLEPMEQSFEYQALEAQLLEHLEPAVNRFVAQPADCAELASKIPADGLLIEYWRCTWPGDPLPVASYVAVVLPKDRPDKAAIVPLCESAALEDLLFEYLSLLSGRSKTADFRSEREVPPDPVRARELGEKIRAVVLDQLQPWTSQAKHLLLVTDGLLGRLPFSALPLGDGYVMDQWLMSYLHTSRDLFGSDDPPRPTGRPIVISDPQYVWPGSTAKENFRFDRLECGAEEGAAIAKILGVSPLSGTEATKQALLTCRCPEILHIATHGMLLPAQPSIAELGPLDPLVWTDPGEARLQLSGLAVFPQNLGRLAGRQLPDQALRSILAVAGVNTWLAGEPLPDAAGNGLVTADDVSAMDLAGNKLTVLSACETGLGVVGIGEGVLGLRSSFPVAGAETIVVSLWSVDDSSTRDLMCRFYQNLIEKRMGRAEALQESQQAIRRQSDDPDCWAPFICQGAIEPLRR